MTRTSTAAALAALIALGPVGMALAQTAPAADGATPPAAAPAAETPAAETPAAQTPAADATAPAADAPAEAPATDAAPNAAGPAGGDQVGSYYTKSTHNSWILRCLRTPDGKDPCELYQLLKDTADKPVAEISVIPFTGQAAAILNFVAPLETDLQAGLGIQIDSGKNNQYPFMVCAPIGCVSRIGLTQAELDSFKRGNKATISLLPFGAEPANAVKLDMSLSGYTAGFTELQTVIQEQQAAQ